MKRLSSLALHSFKQTISQDPLGKGKVQPQHTPSSLVQVQALSKLHYVFTVFFHKTRTSSGQGPIQAPDKDHAAELGSRPKLLQISGLFCPPWFIASSSDTLAQTLLNPWTVHGSPMERAHHVGDHHHHKLSMDTIFKSATASSAVSQQAGPVMDSAQQDAVCLAGSLEGVFYLCIWVNDYINV